MMSKNEMVLKYRFFVRISLKILNNSVTLEEPYLVYQAFFS